MKKLMLSASAIVLGLMSAHGAFYFPVGDASRDGLINVSDITTIVNETLGGGDPLVLGDCDINYDGYLNVGDITSVVDAILSGNDPVVPSDGYAFVWDYDRIPEIHITVSLDEWNRLLSLYDGYYGTKQYVVANIQYRYGNERVEIDDIGIRLRGNTSRRRPEGFQGQPHQTDGQLRHFHIGIKNDKIVDDDDHTIFGVKKLTLKWFKDDPNYVRELYCYDLFRRFGVWTAADGNYCRVWLKIEGDSRENYMGVYSMLEPVDKPFLKRRKKKFETNKGNLWKCEGIANLKTTDTDFWYDDDTDYDHHYCLENNTDKFDDAKAQLQSFIYKLNNKSDAEFAEWFPTICDVDLLLRTYAVNVAVGSWDDYWNNGNNFYIYFNSSDMDAYQFYFIPYDYDNTLGTSWNSGRLSDSGRQNPLQWGHDANPLIKRVLDIPEYRAKYVAYLKELANGPLSYEQSVARIRQWQQSVAEYVANDTGEDMYIYDAPASWGNHNEYRLLEDDPETNFFRVKCATINALSDNPDVPDPDVQNFPYLYTPGSSNGWNFDNCQRLGTQDFKFYYGYININNDLKFTSGPNWASTYDLGLNYWFIDMPTDEGWIMGTLANRVSSNIDLGEIGQPNGLYLAQVYMPTLEFALNHISTIGVVGGFNGWDNDVALTPSDDNLVWTGDVAFTDHGQGWKLRANNGWAINLGGELDNLVADGANLPDPGEGVYTVRLDLRSMPYSVTLTKK